MNEQEFRTGTGAGFEASKDAAEAINADAVVGFDYQAEALQTLSPQWHGELVAKTAFVKTINDSIEALKRLDKIKKSLFYGRDNNLNPATGAMDVQDLPGRMDFGSYNPINVIHGVLGVATEAGELLEALRDGYNGNGFDFTNVKEETGDLFWYFAILASECEFSFDDAQRANIAKLRLRFPNAFTEFDANNYNLVGERKVLES